MTKYESEVKLIYAPRQTVYEKLSDLSQLSSIRERAADPMFRDKVLAMAGDKIKPDQADKVIEVLQKLEMTPDTLTFEAGPLGNITLRIIEREEPKCIKFNLEGAPIQANLWIQLLERDTETLLKCTLGTELNFLLRQMVGNKIQDAANQLATTLAAIPY